MKLSIEFARLAYGEQIMRCTNRPVEAVTDLLCLDGEYEKAHKWIALAIAKREGDPDIIRGLLAYFFANYSGKLDPAKQALLIERIESGQLHLKDLSYELLAGTRLSWDHIFRLCGKSFNPSREKARVREIYNQLMVDSPSSAASSTTAYPQTAGTLHASPQKGASL
jgi:hypothetical protein